MVEQDGKYVFTIDNAYIRRFAKFPLSDDECREVARTLGSKLPDFVATWATEWRVDNPPRHDGCPVTGKLVRQAWYGPREDYAMEVGEVEFDCHLALDRYELSELPPYADWLHDRGYLCSGDDLFWTSVNLGLVADWDGPFEMYVSDFEYEDYMDERVQREYGYVITEREE